MANFVNEKLSGPQKQTLEMICRYFDQNKCSPTFREIGEHFGISIPSVQGRLRTLIEKGYIEKSDGKRGLRILRRCDSVPQFIALAVSGTVLGGSIVPITPRERGKIFIAGAAEELTNCYSLLIGDDSLEHFEIYRDDLLIVRRQRLAENGNLITAALNNDFLVRQLIFQNGNITLALGDKVAERCFIGPQDDFCVTGLIWRITRAASNNDTAARQESEENGSQEFFSALREEKSFL